MSEISWTSAVAVASAFKLSDEVTGPSLSHRLDPADSQSDPTVPPSPSSYESATRPQAPSHDEPYDHSQPERPHYDTVSPRPPLTSQPPSGMHSGLISCCILESFITELIGITVKSRIQYAHLYNTHPKLSQENRG